MKTRCDGCGGSHFRRARVRDLPTLRTPRLADDRWGVYGTITGVDPEMVHDPDVGETVHTGHYLLKLAGAPRPTLTVDMDDVLGVYLPCLPGKGRR